MSEYRQIPVPEQPTAPRDAGESSPQCAWCGERGFEPGFIEDTGQAARGFARWIPGEMQKGIFGGASRFGRERMDITGQRCLSCGYLALFAKVG